MGSLRGTDGSGPHLHSMTPWWLCKTQEPEGEQGTLSATVGKKR